MNKRLQLSITVCFALASVALGQAQSCPKERCAYLDLSLAPDVRAADLVHHMSLDEKISQTVDRAKAIPRLGIAEYDWWNEGLHGVARSGFATVFPQAIALAATWDTPLMQRVADAISTEARARYNESVKQQHFSRYTGLTYWSPNINIFRDPRWGRGQETYGEDPFLTASMGVAFIRGLQGSDSKYFKVIATPKHFAVHSGPEPGRHAFDVHPSDHDLEDTYLPAFRAVITEGHADSIMCAYNAVNGSPACSSDLLLGEYLRDAWGFKGYVVSDCDAVADIANGHHVAADFSHASAQAIRAGTDLDCGTAYTGLGTAIKRGLLTEPELDETLIRLFTARIRLGMFDPPASVPYSQLGQADIDSPQHRDLALQAARESIVLLKNHSALLPLSANKSIAVIGPTADLLQAAEGNYNGASSSPVLLLEGLRKQFRNVIYSPGSELAEGMAAPIPSTALRADKDATVSGLQAKYYDHPDFSGEPRVTRIDPIVNFDWDSIAPAPGLPVTMMAVSWTGFLDVPAAGNYTLSFRGIPKLKKASDATGEGAKNYSGPSHPLRIFVDDKLLVDSAHGQTSAAISFETTGLHSIRVELIRMTNERVTSLQWTTPKGALLPEAITAAKDADVVIACVGLSPDLEGEEMSVKVPGFNGGDRTSIDLPAPQEELLRKLKETGKPLVVILTTGSAVAVNWAEQNADAILEAWYGGEEIGTAVAQTIAGVNNPSGRLPITFYRSSSDLPAFDDYSMSNRTYRYFHGPILYPFGYGLSYSHFKFGTPHLSKPAIQAGEPVTLTIPVTNTGPYEGDDVVELFIDAPNSKGYAFPPLGGFQKFHLAAGEAEEVTIQLDPRTLSRVNDQGERTIREGQYTLHLSEQSRFGMSDSSVLLEVRGSRILAK
ncbi:MAG TPA: glycoside hydrolase family 3 C-terminal domain-containing protein [Terracidiphilus sp.]|jgi:beta-glucosidase